MKAPRRQLHRAFMRWLSRFAIPLRILSRTDDVLCFSFQNVSSSVAGCLSTWEIVISAEFEHTSWHLIFVAEQSARRVPGGYSDMCLPGFQQVFPNREALWNEHLFERLLAWVNEELATASWLVLEGQPGHFTQVRLASEHPGPRKPGSEWVEIVVPLRSRLSTALQRLDHRHLP